MTVIVSMSKYPKGYFYLLSCLVVLFLCSCVDGTSASADLGNDEEIIIDSLYIDSIANDGLEDIPEEEFIIPQQNSISITTIPTDVETSSFSPDDAYDEGYENGYEQGRYDGLNGYNHGYNYDDFNDYYDYYETRYIEGYEEGYDEGYSYGSTLYERKVEEDDDY